MEVLDDVSPQKTLPPEQTKKQQSCMYNRIIPKQTACHQENLYTTNHNSIIQKKQQKNGSIDVIRKPRKMMKSNFQKLKKGISHTFSSFPFTLTEVSFRSRPSKTRGEEAEADEEDTELKHQDLNFQTKKYY